MGQSNKEYGKFTVEEFKQLIRKLPEIRSQMAELPTLLSSVSESRVKEIMGKDLCWAAFYELSFQELLAQLICALGSHAELCKAAQSDDPIQSAFDLFENIEFEEWKGGLDGLFKIGDVVNLLIALQHNALSIMLFHRTLNTMVNEVRSGNDDSFFEAVSIDRSIMTCPTFAFRISTAEASDDKNFFVRLGSALKGPSKKLLGYEDLRYAFYILRESGFNKLSEAQLEALFVDQLKLYVNTYNAGKNLRKQFTNSKKFSTT